MACGAGGLLPMRKQIARYAQTLQWDTIRPLPLAWLPDRECGRVGSRGLANEGRQVGWAHTGRQAERESHRSQKPCNPTTVPELHSVHQVLIHCALQLMQVPIRLNFVHRSHGGGDLGEGSSQFGRS